MMMKTKVKNKNSTQASNEIGKMHLEKCAPKILSKK